MAEIAQEAEILSEIRNAEKEAGIIIEKAQRQKEKILEKAKADSSILLARGKEALLKAQEQKIAAFKEKADFIKNENIEEGRKKAKQLKAKAEKGIAKAVDFVMENFEAAVNTVY